jgi:hypothetical protein
MMPKRPPHYAETTYGFEWNASFVQRLYEREDGSVAIRVGSEKNYVDVFISPAGRSVHVRPRGTGVKLHPEKD